MSDQPSAGLGRSPEQLRRIIDSWRGIYSGPEKDAGEARQPQTVLLVWEGSDVRGVYADTETGRAAAERLRASVQAEYNEWDRKEGREPRERSFIYVQQTRVASGEGPDDE